MNSTAGQPATTPASTVGAKAVSPPPKSYYVKDRPLKSWFKHLFTRIGARLAPQNVQRIQAMVNYLKIGQWMQAHGFAFPLLVESRDEIWAAVVKQVCDRRVLYLEFGVAEGETMSYWSQALKHPEAMLHGFDSFEGLPESDGPWHKGQFSTGGRVPQVDDPRVRFFKGWFDRALPTYSVPAHDVLVINMDADLYSSTIFVLRWLRPHIRPGTFIYFDDLFCLEQELRAFGDFLAESGLKFKPVAAERTLVRAAFECEG